MKHLLALSLIIACGAQEEPAPVAAGEASGERPIGCPASVPAADPLPGVDPAHHALDYWIAQQARYGDVDEVLLSPEAIADHDAALLTGEDPARQPDLTQALTAAEIHTQVAERLAYLREKVQSGDYVEEDGEPWSPDARRALATPEQPRIPSPVLRVATAPIPLRCAPRGQGFYTVSLDLAFDRNNCSTVRGQEPIEVLMTWGDMLLARTRYALGWIARDAPLSPPVPPELREAILRSPRLRLAEAVTISVGGHEVELPSGSLLAPSEDRALIAHAGGFEATNVATAGPTQRALTRRAVLQEAMALVDSPYGWGGQAGGRDCSRYLLDIFAAFGLNLPRHSGRQALGGTFSLDVAEVARGDKALLIDAAMNKGIVLLHFPGHIMLYLGRNAEGEPMAIHSFSEYVTPCDGTEGLETLHRVDRVTISDLTLGEGSSRRDFLSRITRVVVLGAAPGMELQGAATLRSPAPMQVPEECDDSLDVAIFRSPARPHPGQSLRVIVTSTRDLGPVDLVLLGPDGERVPAEIHHTGGPPFGQWVEVGRPVAGRWTAVIGDGSRIEACERFTVARFEPEPAAREPMAAAWVPTWSWERDTENLYAAFVEQLFRDPTDEEVTWTSLQELLREPERNLLRNHRSLDEDDRLELEPDCADLPYFLRAYFAWKLRLPFAWRQCSRGRAGTAPSCGAEPHTNLMTVTASDDLGAFQQLVRALKQNVHSSTQRTVPNTEASDVYPVALTRQDLRPGTIFADPYGHILVVAAWLPQGIEQYGILVAADAQPDGTVGRRRFWRGSFLFDPDTSEAGSGFKAWRPVVYDRREETISLLTNDELRRSRQFARFSDVQYRGTKDEFYSSVEALINPRPLEPEAMQRALVDALEEGVTRRVVSVQNGEEFMRERNFRSITMPEGSAIFQTEGPWEDYSTPSRDLRLLISIDAVIGFPEQVGANPARFGVETDEVASKVEALRTFLSQELATRQFEAPQSAEGTISLTLADIVDRREAFEMAYNPNDCLEIRWGAAEGSEEMGTCERHASREQRSRMTRYRPWFHSRERPAR